MIIKEKKIESINADGNIESVYVGSDLVYLKKVPIVYVKSTDGIFYYISCYKSNDHITSYNKVNVTPNIITEVKLITNNIKGYSFYGTNNTNNYNQGLVYLDVSNIDFSNSTDLGLSDYQGLFSSNFKLETIKIPDLSIMTNVRKLYMFHGCGKLKTIICNQDCKDWLIANNNGNNIKLPTDVTWEIID